MNILIVDDNPAHLELMRAQLESEGHKITEAHDGAEALELLDHQHVDAVISDIFLPRRDGSRLCHEIRRHDHLRKLPTIIYSSTFSSPEDVNLALERGATKRSNRPASLKIILAPTEDAATKRPGNLNPEALSDAEVLMTYSQWLVDRLADEKSVLEEVKANLSATRDQLAHLMKHSLAVLYSLKLEGERVIPQPVSENLSRLLGFTADESRPFDWWEKQLHLEDRSRVMAGIFEVVTAGIWNGEYRIRHKAGHYLWIEDHQQLVCDARGEPANIVGVRMNITQRKQDENNMLREQRLAGIGTLACNVAHDLNNLLVPIMLTAEMLRVDNPGLPDEPLELIETGAKRGVNMVKQLLTFVKGDKGPRLPVQTQPLLDEVARLVKISFPTEIKLQKSLAKDLLPITGDVTQLQQVLLNLCVNARDAMPNGGTMTLKAENIRVDTIPAGAVGEFKPGTFVALSVIDTGTGIPPEVLDRIFEPFFSTKGPEKGTGLGLSTVVSILKSHGGLIAVNSTPGQGSAFTIYLPAAKVFHQEALLPCNDIKILRSNGTAADRG